jgi:hypothetical protein
MKHRYLFLLILIMLMLPSPGHTQDKVTAIDSLAVEIWPDYDRASVLVLLTGTLLADAKLPASITLPFPAAAQLNAVARVDSGDGEMKDITTYTQTPDEITFVTTVLQFRVEYYFPYTLDNDHRTFTFKWSADLSVNNFQIRVQQPKSASSLTTVPGTIDVASEADGFTYHAFPIKFVPAGQPFSVTVDYTMDSDQLSVASLVSPGVEESASPPLAREKAGINWSIVVMVVGGIIILVVLVWQFAARRAGSSRPEVRPAESKSASASRFCTHCGNPIAKEDKFCSKCGSALKER